MGMLVHGLISDEAFSYPLDSYLQFQESILDIRPFDYLPAIGIGSLLVANKYLAGVKFKGSALDSLEDIMQELDEVNGFLQSNPNFLDYEDQNYFFKLYDLVKGEFEIEGIVRFE